MSDSAGGFKIGDLFDFKFKKFVTTEVVRILYGLSMIVAFFAAAGMAIGAFTQGTAYGLVMVVVAVIAFLFYVTLARVWLEVMVVIFRIAENTQKIADNSGTPE